MRAPEKYEELIKKAAEENGVPVELLDSLLYQESGYNEDVISGKRQSSAGALGIAQFMPETARSMGIDPLDPNQAINGSAQYLKQQYDRFGSWDKALAAYNAGPGNVSKYGGVPPFSETQNYVSTILGQQEVRPLVENEIRENPQPTEKQQQTLVWNGEVVPEEGVEQDEFDMMIDEALARSKEYLKSVGEFGANLFGFDETEEEPSESQQVPEGEKTAASMVRDSKLNKKFRVLG